MNAKKKRRILGAALAVLCVAVAVGVIFRQPQPLADLRYTQEYVAGAPGIQGQVDTEAFLAWGEEYAIGANQYGRAVFKDPAAAFQALRRDCAGGLRLIRAEFGLMWLCRFNYQDYGTYGWQAAGETQAEQEQARFVSRFMDIYENSFRR